MTAAILLIVIGMLLVAIPGFFYIDNLKKKNRATIEAQDGVIKIYSSAMREYDKKIKDYEDEKIKMATRINDLSDPDAVSELISRLHGGGCSGECEAGCDHTDPSKN